MKKANIDYSLEEKETMNEDKLRSIIKELIKEDSLFNIDPTIAYKIYHLLKSKYPKIGEDYAKASFFFHFLNDNLK